MRYLILAFLISATLQANAQQNDWFSLGKYIGFFAGESDPYKDPIVEKELKRILGKDHKAYMKFESQAGSARVEFANGLIHGDRSHLHVGGYNSKFFIDTTNRKMYLFWLTERVWDKKYKIYGDRPIPQAVLKIIEEDMNIGWGHVASFKVVADSIAIDLK